MGKGKKSVGISKQGKRGAKKKNGFISSESMERHIDKLDAALEAVLTKSTSQPEGPTGMESSMSTSVAPGTSEASLLVKVLAPTRRMFRGRRETIERRRLLPVCHSSVPGRLLGMCHSSVPATPIDSREVAACVCNYCRC